jgi:hypothetical protein
MCCQIRSYDSRTFSKPHSPQYIHVCSKPNVLNSAPTSAEGTLRRTACARAQFSGCSSTTNAHSEMGQMEICCQNLPLGALTRRSAPSLLVGALFKKFGLFLNTRRFRKMWQENCAPSQKVRSRKHPNNGRNVGNDVSPVEGTILKGTVLKMLYNKIFITKIRSFFVFEHALYIAMCGLSSCTIFFHISS